MAHGLISLQVRTRDRWNQSEEEADALVSYNGDFLPIVKEKLCSRAKAALISVVMNIDATQRCMVAVRQLDANISSLIFAFAATPERRTVRAGAERGPGEQYGRLYMFSFLVVFVWVLS